MTDTQETTPTATDLAREVMLAAMDAAIGGWPNLHHRLQADAILAALAAKGLTIAGPGMVVVSRERMVGTLGDAIDEWIATDDGDDLMVYLTRWLDAAPSGTNDQPAEDDK